jgi:hypothetical protein
MNNSNYSFMDLILYSDKCQTFTFFILLMQTIHLLNRACCNAKEYSLYDSTIVGTFMFNFKK